MCCWLLAKPRSSALIRFRQPGDRPGFDRPAATMQLQRTQRRDNDACIRPQADVGYLMKNFFRAKSLPNPVSVRTLFCATQRQLI